MSAAAATPARVDLAVLDDAQDLLGQMNFSQTANALIAARDAMRELIRLHERTLYVHTLTGNAKALAWDKLDRDIRALLAQVSP